VKRANKTINKFFNQTVKKENTAGENITKRIQSCYAFFHS
jgi:hypothetical protein